MHRCYEHIEDLHVTFSRQENSILKMCMCFFALKNIIFDKITAVLTLTFQTLVSSID